MFKNAILSIKKSVGKSVLLFILMAVIANLIIAGLSIKNATSKSMEQVRKSLGNDVTLSYNMRNIMQNRQQGEALDSVMKNITIEMADRLKDLKYVENYNYTVNVNVSSDDIEPVNMQENSNQTNDRRLDDMPRFMDSDDFSVVGHTTMEYLTNFTNKNYVLKSGRLLVDDDAQTTNCVIESNLASDNDLKVGSSFKVYSTNEDNEKISVTLKVVGIFEIETSDEMGGMMSNRQSPMNTIYTGLSTAQKLNDSTTTITSATYYLDDPDHIDDFQQLAQDTDIDFETYTLDANDGVYQKSIASLENMESFANIFLSVVIVAGSVILCLILVLTMRSRFYEFGVMLSLGQSKLKIIGQQLVEILSIALLAFALSLTTGKMVSNVISNMLVTQDNQSVVMNMEESNDQMSEQMNNRNLVERMQAPASSELDVSLTGDTILKLAEISFIICVVSIILPSLYVLRLSPREILVKREG